jgi:hypothetical protein
MGLHWQTLAYNAFAISTLTFVAQLEVPPTTTKTAEHKGLSLAIQGPNGIGPKGWATPQDMWRLREDYGQQASCRSLDWLSEATLARVYLADPACINPQFQQNLQHLRHIMSIPNNLPMWAKWQDWYRRSFAITLHSNYTNLVRKIGHIQNTNEYKTHQQKIQSYNQEHPHNKHKRKIPIQKLIYKQLSQLHRPHPFSRIQHKLQRWLLTDPIKTNPPPNTYPHMLTNNWQTQRLSLALQQLSQHTPPRVRAAVFSTIWNRWNTGRRWQKRKRSENQCLFGCDAEDSIEHYCHCGTTKLAMRKFLRLDPYYFANVHTFMLVNQHIQHTDTLITIALLIYGLYNTTNTLRNHKEQQPNHDNNYTYNMLVQNIKNGARGHPISTLTLDHRWANTNSTQNNNNTTQDNKALYNYTINMG